MRRVLFQPEARHDVLETQRWYEEQRSGLGVEFRQELKRAIEAIRENPSAWPILRRRTRRCLMYRFPYGIFYRVERDQIIVVGVIHGHRDPRIWRKRM